MKGNESDQIKNFQLIIESLPKKRNFLTHEILHKPFFVKSENFESLTTKYPEELIFRDNEINYFFAFFPFAMCFLVIFKCDLQSDNFYFSIGIIVFLLSLMINLKFKRHRLIIINKKGFKIDNDKFLWEDIYDYGVFVSFGYRKKTQVIYIFSIDRGLKKYDISGFHQIEIMKTLNSYRREQKNS